MARISIIFGVILILLGVGGYFATGQTSWTALIPAIFFGLPILLCGIVALKEKLRMHAAHVAALVGVLGVLGGLGMSIPKIMKSEAGTSAIAQLVMGIICAVYVVLCVRSFIAARKARKAAEKAAV